MLSIISYKTGSEILGVKRFDVLSNHIHEGCLIPKYVP